MKIVILFISILIIPAAAQNILTAEEAIRIGLQSNYDIMLARNTLQIADNNTRLGTAEFLPSLNVNGSRQYDDTRETSTSQFSFGDSKGWTQSASVSLNWTIFDGFQMFVNKTRYSELYRLGEFQTRNIIEAKVVQILRAYFNVVQQQQLYDATEDAFEISQTRLEKEKVRKEVGGASSTDYLNAQVAYNNDRVTLINQELNLLIAKNDLNLLLNREPGVEFATEGTIIIPALDTAYDSLFALASRRNSALRIAKQNLILAENNRSLRAAGYYPLVSLNGSYSYTDRTRDSERFQSEIKTESNNSSVGLTLSWNLFNGFRDNVQRQNATIEVRSARLRHENAALVLAAQIREKFVTLDKRLDVVELEEENVIAAEQNLRVLQDRYQIGTASSLEFRDAQLNLFRAQTTLILARYQARISRLEIDQLTGTLALE